MTASLHPAKAWDADGVFDLFSSGAPWYPRALWVEYDDMAKALNERWVIARRRKYRVAPEPTAESGDRQRYQQAFRGPGGEPHSLLKWYAWCWLRDQGEASPEYEQWVQGRRVDLAARSLHWVAECGDTDPRRLLDILATREWDRFVLFPFHPPDAYVFGLTRLGHRMLDQRRAARMEILRQAVDRL